jgi:hypothetical protein
LGSNINFTIGKNFFNNRFRISTGVGYDAPLQQSGSQQGFSQQLLPDVTLEWLVNPSGTVRASFFYRENTDYMNTLTTGGPGKGQEDRSESILQKRLLTVSGIFSKGKRKRSRQFPSQQEGVPVKPPGSQ